MKIGSFLLGCTVGSALTAGAGYLIYKRIIEPKMWVEIERRVDLGIESYKEGLDRAADKIISEDDATKLVKQVQSQLAEGESVTPLQSFSSLEDETPDDDNEPVAYSDIYSQYHKSTPSSLFNYDDDIPKDIKSDQLDLEAEAVVQENAERIERFEQMQAERESPEEDFDPEMRSERRRIERERSKEVHEITEEEFFKSNRDFDKETILYYKKDGIMCYENEDIIMDREEILGPNFVDWVDAFRNTKVTSEQGKSIYLRSDFLKTDYEVIVYAGSYEHFVNGPAIG